MGKRGPTPEPSKFKLLKGNPGHRPINEDEPKPEVTPIVPDPPDWLEAYAKAEWHEVAPRLHSMGLLTVVDLSFFAAYCQSYARWRAAEEWISEAGVFDELRAKDVKVRSAIRSPQAMVSRDALADMNRFGSAFGLSPSARTNIQAVPAAKADNKFTKLG